MTITKISRGASLAIMSVALLAQPIAAAAQTVPGGSVNQTAGASASLATSTDTSGMQRLDDVALVRGEPETLATRHSEPGAPRFMVESDDMTKITRQSWLKHGWSNDRFDAMRHQNVGFCQKTSNYALRLNDALAQYHTFGPRIAEIKERYAKLGGQIKRAGLLRTLGNLLTIGLSVIVPGSGWAYRGMVAGGVVGGEAQGQASTKGQLVARDHGDLTADMDYVHVDLSALSAEMHLDYLELVTGQYCANDQVLRTFDGTAPTQ